MTMPTDWQCLKCGSKDFEIGEVRTAGGFQSSFFDLGNRRFEYCSCKQCTYSEFYKGKVKGVQKVLDFLGSSQDGKTYKYRRLGQIFQAISN